MDLSNELDWKHATAEDIDRAVNGSISSGELIKTAAAKTILNRLLYALDRTCQINEANPLIKEIIYNLHREMDGLPPVKSLDGIEVQVFNIFVPRGESGCSANELYIIESGKIVRFAELNIDNDLFSNRLKQYFIELCRESVTEI
jgi:hypothetical protein